MKMSNSVFKVILGLTLAVYLIGFNRNIRVHATENEEEVKEPSYNSVVEVSDYKIEGDYLRAGKETNITLTLHNANKRTPANSLVAVVSSESKMVFPSYGNDNQFFIGSLEANTETTITIPVVVNSDLSGDYVDFICTLVYECGGSRMSNTCTMVLPTENTTSIVVNSLEISHKATVNGKSLLSINYSNNSTTNISDVILTVNGSVSEESKIIELGSIASGKTNIKDCNVMFTEAGEQSVNITLSYTDSNGVLTETDLGTYSISVDEESNITLTEDDGNSVIIWAGRFIALIAFVAAAYAVWFYVYKR